MVTTFARAVICIMLLVGAICSFEVATSRAEKSGWHPVLEGQDGDTRSKEPVRRSKPAVPKFTTRLWQICDELGNDHEACSDSLLGDAYDLAYNEQNDLLYVSSTFNRSIVVLRGMDGSVLRQIGSHLSGYDLGVPLGLGLDREGNLYVVDGAKNTILVLAPEGSLIRTITVARQQTEKELRLTDVAILSDGSIFVTDNANGRVIALDRGGRPIKYWGEADPQGGRFAGVTKIAVTADSNLYVVDGLARRVLLISPRWGPISSFGEGRAQEDAYHFYGPSDLVSLDNGNVLVSDTDCSCLREYELREGQSSLVSYLMASEWERTPIFNPIAVTGNGKDLVFVLDIWGGRVSAFRVK